MCHFQPELFVEPCYFCLHCCCFFCNGNVSFFNHISSLLFQSPSFASSAQTHSFFFFFLSFPSRFMTDDSSQTFERLRWTGHDRLKTWRTSCWMRS